ncbi:MAG: hypothetical protein LBQ22_00755 [Bacteroidales bacterium]|jgi:hypothetical protein|nr:hypothetical protein [Bacteroidales bacterium]
MRKNLLALLIFIPLHCFSQSVSVELSIVWSNENSLFYERYNLEKNPYLKINYKNLSDSCIYFKKIYENNAGMPIFIDYETPEKYKYPILPFFSSPNKKYTCYFYDSNISTNYIEVVHDSILGCYQEHELDYMSIDLAQIYDSLFILKGIDSIMKNNFTIQQFYPSITEYNILTELKNHFVFLSPNEDFSEYFDLIGLYVTGCQFSFEICKNKFSKYVTVGYFQKEQIQLPMKVGRYNLYYDEFFYNKTSVDFYKFYPNKE